MTDEHSPAPFSPSNAKHSPCSTHKHKLFTASFSVLGTVEARLPLIPFIEADSGTSLSKSLSCAGPSSILLRRLETLPRELARRTRLAFFFEPKMEAIRADNHALAPTAIG